MPIKTAGPPARLMVQADRTTLNADGKDLCFITVKVVDADGNPVPDANTLLKFDVLGEGSFVAADGGDPVSHESFQAKENKAFNGLCLVVIKAKPALGKVVLTVTAEGLRRGLLEC